MNILSLVTDAYGGFGGIAQYNRDLLRALGESPLCERITALPRVTPGALGPLPQKLDYITAAAGSKGRYVAALARAALRSGPFDAIFCGHINLLPLAAFLRPLLRAPVVLQAYGIDVFKPPQSRRLRDMTDRVDLCLPISRATRARLLAWSHLCPEQCIVLTPTYDAARFTPGPRDAVLEERLGLCGKQVLLTVGRLAPTERYKGHDAVIAVLPQVLERWPQVVYAIAGDGADRPRLEALARARGVTHAVRFLGQLQDQDLPGVYRLADLFVMPSTGEGFGIVFIEAIATGVPAIAGDGDGARDALRDGTLGALVNPGDPAALRDAILTTLDRRNIANAGVACFNFSNFAARVHKILTRLQTLR